MLEKLAHTNYQERDWCLMVQDQPKRLLTKVEKGYFSASEEMRASL